jgi:hypothetical protein
MLWKMLCWPHEQNSFKEYRVPYWMVGLKPYFSVFPDF